MKAIYFAKQLGVINDLLYWGRLFDASSGKLPDLIVVSLCNRGCKAGNGYSVRQAPPVRSIGLCWIFLKIVIMPRQLTILNEFSVLTFVGCLRSFVMRDRVLLLVENHPKFITKYNVTRTGVIHSLYRRFIAYSADCILTNNRDGFDYLVRELDVNPRKILEAPYLTSELRVSPRENKDANPKWPVRFLFVGQMIERKGVDLLLRAFELVNTYEPDSWELYLAGSGELHEQYEECGKKLFGHKIKFLGAVPYSEMNRCFETCDVFVWPTRADYRALVGFEAISAGLPVVFSKNDGAAAEVVEDGVNGFIVDPDNDVEFAEKILEFIRDRNKVSLFGQRSAQRFEKFTLEKAAQNFVNACERAMQRY